MAEDVHNRDNEIAQDDSTDIPSTNSEQNISRRQLLKVLTASGVVTAVSLVPKKWSTPIIEGGVLPAHAQVTPTYTIRCSGDQDIPFREQQEETLDFTATVRDASANPPPTGTPLTAVLNTNPVQTQTVGTDPNGEVQFLITVNVNNIVNNTVIATVSFEDPQSFGPSFCQVTFNFLVPNGV